MLLVSPVTVSVVAVLLKVWAVWAVPADVGGDHVAGDGRPPLLAGAVQVTVADAVPAVAVPMVGAPGVVAGVTELEAAEAPRCRRR